MENTDKHFYLSCEEETARLQAENNSLLAEIQTRVHEIVTVLRLIERPKEVKENTKKSTSNRTGKDEKTN